MGDDRFMPQVRVVPEGGVTSAAGFRAAGVHGGFQAGAAQADCAVLLADKPVPAAALFTRNAFCGAPVAVSREHLGGAADGCGLVQAVVLNTGNANAGTGAAGMAVAHEACDIASQVIGCEPGQVLLASTGAIGAPLPIEPFEAAVPAACDEASVKGGSEAAQVLAAGDLRSREVAVVYESQVLEYVGCTFTVGGTCAPARTTTPEPPVTLAVLTTDAPVTPEALRCALACAARPTLGHVAVVPGSSVSDTCILMASGAAGVDVPLIEADAPAFAEFASALRAVCESLARSIASDGRDDAALVTVTVAGAATDGDADAAARAIAASPSVRQGLAARSGAWGAIATALGASGATFERNALALDLMELPVCRGGVAVPVDEDELTRRFEAPELLVFADLGVGSATSTVWTRDRVY